MAIANMLAGIGGFTEGWKAMDDIIKSHQQMQDRADRIEGYRTGQKLSGSQAAEMDKLRADPRFGVGGGDTGDIPTEASGSSTPVPPGAEIPEASTSGIENATRIAKVLKDEFNWTPAAIAGALNNGFGESGGAAWGNPGKGGELGFFQFHPKTHLPLFLQEYSGDTSPEAQARYMANAVNNDRSMQGYGQVGDPQVATSQFLRGFERPKDQSDAVAARRFGYNGQSQSILSGLVKPASALGMRDSTSVEYRAPSTEDPDLIPSAARAPFVAGPVVAEAPIPPPPATRALPIPGPAGSTPSTSMAPAPPPPPIVNPGPTTQVVPPGRAQPAGRYNEDSYPYPYAGRGTSNYTPYVPGSGGGTPIMPGASAGGDNPYNTRLQPSQEASFRAWVKNNKVKFNPDADMTDYDMRGFWQAQQQRNPRAQTAIDPDSNEVHYPDFWKTPIHKTFSNESQWAPPGAPHWENGRLISNDGTVLVDRPSSALGQ